MTEYHHATDSLARADRIRSFDPALARDVVDGLGRAQKSLPSAWFYDDEGSRLFRQITALPEYYLTRVEHEILCRHGDELARWIAPRANPVDLVELGSGDGEKTLVLCEALFARASGCVYHPVDVAREALERLQRRYSTRISGLPIRPLLGDYFSHWPDTSPDRRQVAMLMGSNLGNFTESEAIALLRRIRSQLRPGDGLLMGLDLKKDPHLIRAAYDDVEGVTARFNLNLLLRLNRELGMDFDPTHFSHYASYSPLDGVARSFLVSRRRQVVRSHLLARTFMFEEGEAIFTEQSQKYCRAMIDRLAAASGFAAGCHFTDARRWYAVVGWCAASDSSARHAGGTVTHPQ